MKELQQRINQSFQPILTYVPGDRWQEPKIPISVMDPLTYQLIQIQDLYSAINYTQTKIGAVCLLRSLSQPLTDSQLITAKQKSLQEVRDDSGLRKRLKNLIAKAGSDEKLLLSHFNEDYYTSWIGNPHVYQSFQGSARLLQKLMTSTQDFPAQTDYLQSLIQNFKDLEEDDVADFIKGPVFKTFKGLKPKREIKPWTPELKFIPRDAKLIRLLLLAAPAVAGVSTSVLADGQYVLLGAYGMMLYTVWPFHLTSLGRKFDNFLYVKPLSDIYFKNPRVINALESMGKIDELLSLAEYANSIQAATTLPQVVNSPNHFFQAKNLKNPVVIKDNSKYVGNDVSLDGQRVTIITGPNSGGKTSLSKTILQSQVLAQIGSYIVAEEGKVAVADGIFYHSPMINSLQDEEGRFGVEIARTKDIFYKTTPKTLVALDELIEATTYEEKLKHSKVIIDGFWALGGNTILVTHNHHLAQGYLEEGKGQFWQVEFRGDKASHKIIPGISTESHSEKVLERIGFTEEDIQRYLREKSYLTG